MGWTKLAEEDTDVTFMVKVTKSFAEEFERMLTHLKGTAGSGHSFSIVVDPESNEPETFGMDGDGSDHIRSVERMVGGDHGQA